MSHDSPPDDLTSFHLPSRRDREGEAEWIQRLREGDQEAFGCILKVYWNDLRFYAMGMLEEQDLADDIVQEAFARLWERRTRWRPTDTVRPVLYRIVRNLALNEQRRLSTVRKWAHRVLGPEQDPAPSPLATIEGEELRGIIQSGLDRLPERRREIFLLVRHHQMSYREVAETLGISTQTVANQVGQALQDLRKVLRPHFRNDPPREIRLRREREG